MLKYSIRPLTLGLTLCASVAFLPTSATANDSSEDLFSMSLSELSNIEITSVSKRSEKASEVAAAVHVITSEDIARSGASSIPEALRLAPGVNVARAGAHDWAVSIRGFNAQFANKLLVLIDGRTVYTPLFSGVFWDIQDTLLEDVDRIEVIRGPGGTIWGANAVNGVINIITKDAKDTQGTYAMLQQGILEQKSAIRYGGEIDENTHYRAFAQQKHHRELNMPSSNSGSNDSWDQWRAGMKVDMDKLKVGKLTIQSEAYAGTEDSDLLLPNLSAPFTTLVDDKFDVSGAHILAQWSHIEGSNEYSLKGYYDLASRDNFVFENNTQTIDLDFNHSFKMWDHHNMIWGLGYRLINTDISGTAYLDYTPANRTDNLFSAFLQDKVDLYNKEVFLTLGSKFEHNDYTGFEWQPSARLSWLASENQTLWASVSRAVRTPTRATHNINIAVAAIPSAASPTGSLLIRQLGNNNAVSEELIAYEAGYRFKPAENISTDIAIFYNDYPTLSSDSRGAPYLDNNDIFGQNVVLPLTIGSNSSGRTYGGELSVDWQATSDLRLSSSYSLLEIDLEGGTTFVAGEGKSPHHQFNLETHYTPDENWELDGLLYYVDELNPSSNTVIPSYWRLDTRVAYNFENGMKLSLVGQNLLDDQKSEFSSFVYNQQVAVPRTVYGQISWNF